MGRYYFDKKDVVEDYRKLTITDLKRFGFLLTYLNSSITWTSSDGNKNSIGVQSSPSTNNPHIRLHYTRADIAGEKQVVDYEVRLATTPCNYGGERYWFICPLSVNGTLCGRRVAALYNAGKYFGCRHCYNLSYESRNESKRFRGYPFKIITNDIKIEKLYMDMKRKYYAGKPTKTYAKILRLKAQQGDVGKAYLAASM